ncbi:MAG: ABC transporter ATP-binding protein, partial [Tepidisphaeraceae bacterium]
VGQRVQFRLRQAIHDKLHELPLAYHDRHSPGRLLTHLFSDVNALENGTKALMQNVMAYALSMIVGLAIVLATNAKLALLVIVALPAYWVCYQWFQQRLRRVNENLREREGLLNAHISNRVSNFHLVKSFVRESAESLDFLRSSRPIIRNNIAATMLATGFVGVCGLITGTCTTIILWQGTLQVRDGRMTVGEMLMFFGSASYLFTPIAVMTNLASVYYRTRAVAQKILRVLDEPITLADPEEPVEVPSTACEVKLEDVTLHYDPTRPAALANVSFTLPAGKRLCVMGPSGSGKSTLAKVIGRLYDPTHGRVLFDDIDVRSFKITDLRQLVGFVSQEPIVFSGTIADNIRYGSQYARQDAMVRAAQYAQIHDFIDRLPERYRTLTHERGLTLSGGQKQRVNLARALVHDPRVIVLDDCTSALDADTEARLVDSFQTALSNRTAVLVTHRVSVAMACDYVLMLDGGKMDEFGPPRQLLNAAGPFASIFQEQMNKGKEAESSQKLTLANQPATAGV